VKQYRPRGARAGPGGYPQQIRGNQRIPEYSLIDRAGKGQGAAHQSRGAYTGKTYVHHYIFHLDSPGWVYGQHPGSYYCRDFLKGHGESAYTQGGKPKNREEDEEDGDDPPMRMLHKWFASMVFAMSLSGSKKSFNDFIHFPCVLIFMCL
jgi:hypothetical protein